MTIYHKRIIPTGNNRLVYWIQGEKDDKRALVGYYLTSEEAERDGELKFGIGHYKVYPLHTIDSVRASKIIRRLNWDETNSIEEAFRRFNHKERNQGVI